MNPFKIYANDIIMSLLYSIVLMRLCRLIGVYTSRTGFLMTWIIWAAASENLSSGFPTK